METQTRGPPAGTRSGPFTPSCASARGRLASITTSACRTRSWRTRMPSGLCKSSATDRLRPFNRSKNSRGPRRAPSGRCVDSTFTTVAPARARRSPHSGPAQSAERSTTTIPVTSGRGGASPRSDRDTPACPTDSPTRAAGSPSSAALARRCAGSPSRRFDATADHMAGTEPGTASSSSHAGTDSMSSSRGSDTAMKPSADRSRRQLPPQLTAPRRHRPMSAARSPSSANASNPGNERASRSIPSTRPAGGPRGSSRQPGQRHGAALRPAPYPGVLHASAG